MDSRFLYDTGVEMIHLVKATLHCYRKFSRESIKDENISFCGLQILTTLKYYPNCNTISNIANSLNVSKGLISREVEELHKGGYVETKVDSKDRRIMRIQIVSPNADTIVKKHEEKIFSFIMQMLEGFSDQEIGELKKLNSRIFENTKDLDLDREFDIPENFDNSI